MLAFVLSALPLLALVAADDIPVDERCVRTVIVEEGDTCDFICESRSKCWRSERNNPGWRLSITPPETTADSQPPSTVPRRSSSRT